MSAPPIRVLIIDDSAFTRKVLREILERQHGIEVVGVARDGLEALEKIQQLEPDVLTLDLVMPILDGVGLLRELPKVGGPRVVVVSTSDSETERGAEALQLGAVDLVHKPTALATDRLYELGTELVAKVRLAAAARTLPPPAPAELEPVVAPPPAAPALVDLIVMGTSTGGPQALTRLLSLLPATLPAPLAIALHIPASYTEALARRLDTDSPLTVVEARDGMPLVAGSAYLCPGGHHLTLVRDAGALVARLDRRSRGLYVPSVDALFESAAAVLGARTLGVVLTGMGDDGLLGCKAIKAAGGQVLTEAALSCVVHGMPRAVDEAGLSDHRAPLWRLPAEIVRRVTTS